MLINDLYFSVGQIVGDHIYASNYMFNGLFRVHIYTGEAEFLDFFPKEKIYQRELHRDAILFDNNVIFIPANAENIAIYNVEKCKWKMVEGLKELDEGANAVVWKEKLYIIPVRLTDCIQILNLHTFNLETESELIDNWYEMQKILPDVDPVRAWRIALKEDSLWMAIANTNQLLKIDLNKLQLHILDTPCHDLMCLYGGEKGFWLLPYHGNIIYQWNPKTNLCMEYECDNESIEKRYIGAVIEYNNEIFAIPAHAENIMQLKKEKEKFVKWMDYSPELKWRDERLPKFFRHVEHDGKIYLLPFNINGILIVEDQIDFIPITSMGDDWEKIPLKQYVNSMYGELVKEECDFGIEDLLSVVSFKEIEIKEETVGRNLYQAIKGELYSM